MSDEAQVQAMLTEFGQAVNEHDAQRIGRCWAEDGNFVDMWGRLAFGRRGVEEMFEDEFRGAFADARFRAERVELRSLGDGTIVGECDSVFENVRAPNGRMYDLPHRVDAVFVRRDGEWKFFSAHPSFRRHSGVSS